MRSASIDDALQLAELKAAWADATAQTSLDDLTVFARDLATWMECRESVVVRVAEQDQRLVGMAWLVIFERVPNIDARVRQTGDIQSVFVLPEYRRRGVGHALVESLLAVADERGIARVMVSANAQAAGLYRSLGFQQERLLLQRRGSA